MQRLCFGLGLSSVPTAVILDVMREPNGGTFGAPDKSGLGLSTQLYDPRAPTWPDRECCLTFRTRRHAVLYRLPLA